MSLSKNKSLWSFRAALAFILVLSFALSALADVPVKGIFTLQNEDGTELNKQDNVYVIDQGTTVYMDVVWDDSVSEDIKYTEFNIKGTSAFSQRGYSTNKGAVHRSYEFLYDGTFTITVLGYDKYFTVDPVYQANTITVKVNKNSNYTPPDSDSDSDSDSTPDSTQTEDGKKSDGGGGCSAGFTGFTLLFAVPFGCVFKDFKKILMKRR